LRKPDGAPLHPSRDTMPVPEAHAACSDGSGGGC
jgi:hypothetical protein